MLKDFIKEEVDEINGLIEDRRLDVPPVEDPSDEIIHVINEFLDWYNTMRQPLLTTSEIVKLAKKTRALQELLKTTFPDRSGEIWVLWVCATCVLSVFYSCAVCVLVGCCVLSVSSI